MSYLTPYQLDYFKKRNNLIYVKSRQIGITHTAALKSLVRSLDGEITHYVAQDFPSSKNFIKEVVYFLDLFGIEQSFYDATQSSIVFATKGKIDSLTSNPRALRGRKGNVILDEFAFHDDQEQLLAAAQPVTTWGGSLEIISTKNGNTLFFNSLIEKAENNEINYDVMKTSIFDAAEAGLVDKINKSKKLKQTKEEFIEELKHSVSSLTWRQEYCCEDLKNDEAIVTWDMYSNVIDNKLNSSINIEQLNIDDIDSNRVFCGIDIGRSKNWTVFWAIEKNDDFYRTVFYKVIKNEKIEKQINILSKFIEILLPRKVYIDQGVFGLSIYEALNDKFGNKIVGISINKKLQMKIIDLVRKNFEQSLISVPSDIEVQQDMCSVSLKYNQNTIKVEGSTALGSHGDSFYAIGLALDAASYKELVVV